MLYLLDANVLITADEKYYPIERVPEFWAWLQYCGTQNQVKVPIEILEEIQGGKRQGGSRQQDPLIDWLTLPHNLNALLLDEDVDQQLLQNVVEKGYAPDLTDIEYGTVGRDPFLIAYGIAQANRCIVTLETSKPGAQRQNRRIPDVCSTFGVRCCDPFSLNRELDFRTSWKN